MLKRQIWNSESRLEIGGRQLASTEYLLGGLLGVIIVGALVMVIYQQFIRGSGPTGVQGDGKLHYKCEVPSCGNEFIIDPNPPGPPDGKGPPMGPGPRMDMAMGPQPMDCPKCGARQSCWPMILCPKCHKYYLPQEKIRPGMGPQPSPQVRNVCPYCGTDYIDYWIKQYK
ncbi:MAG: hypothetical protein ACE15C_18720 [Phycisphaerae bacterium]